MKQVKSLKLLLQSVLFFLLTSVVLITILLMTSYLSLGELIPFKTVVQQISENCKIQMSQRICTLVTSNLNISKNQKILIAGYGEVNASIIADLNQYENYMCSPIEKSCLENFNSEICKIGRALYLKSAY